MHEKNIKIIFILFVLIILIQIGCETQPQQNFAIANLQSKDGDSCLIEQQCKVIVTQRGRITPGNHGNKFFRCLITNGYYQVIKEGNEIKVDSNKCEEINP
jgi:hypothetical protein